MKLYQLIIAGVVALAAAIALSFVSFTSGTVTGVVRTVQENAVGGVNFSLVTIGLRQGANGGIADTKYLSIRPGSEALVKKLKLAQLKGEPVVLTYSIPVVESLQVFTAHGLIVSKIETQEEAVNSLK
jgi:hypothetical protein